MQPERLKIERQALYVLCVDKEKRDIYSGVNEKCFTSSIRKYIYRLCKKLKCQITFSVIKQQLSLNRKAKLSAKERVLIEFRIIIKEYQVEKGQRDYTLEELLKYTRTDSLIGAVGQYITLVKKGKMDEAEAILSGRVLEAKIASGKLAIDEGEVIADLPTRIERVCSEERRSRREVCTFGLKALDSRLVGIWPKELCIVFGRSDVGKSILALNIAHANRLLGRIVHYISLEMDREQLEYRYDSLVSGLKYRDNFKLAKIDRNGITRWKESLITTAENGGKLYITGVGGECTMTDLDNYIYNTIYKRGKPHLVIIDFLDMLSWGARMFSEQHEQGKIVLALKRMCQKYRFASLGITHQNIRSDKFDEDLDQEDMGYSKRKVHYGDLVLGLYKTTQDTEDGLMTIRVVKGREGHTGVKFKVRPELDYMRYSDVK